MDDFYRWDFHGIGFDYFKMMSILENGILSMNAAKDMGIEIKRNYGGFNDNNAVSIALNPYGNKNIAYKSFCENSICFAFKHFGLKYAFNPNEFKKNNKKELFRINLNDFKESSGIDGERFVNYKIPRESIMAIILPVDKINTKIDCIEMINHYGTGYFDDLGRNIIDKIYEYFGYDKRNEIYELIDSKKSLNDIDINNKINELLSKYFSEGIMLKYNLSECPTLFQTVYILSKGSIDIYANNGQKIFEAKEEQKRR